jgi:hypothetical protein
VDVKPPPYPEYRTQWERPTHEYRVVIWEQPALEEGDPDDIDPETIGWGEMTFDLVDVEDVHEAIEWAEQQLVANRGPYSKSGGRVRDHEYVLYAKVPGEDRFVQIAGWDPSRNSAGKNLRRVG